MAKSKIRQGYGTGNPHPIDVHVGARVRVRRTLLGMTQTDLGDALGLTFQQVQKYERGTNRISSSRLYDLARVLDLSVENFFDELSPDAGASSPAKGRGKEKRPPRDEPDPLARRETLELVRAYYKIEDANVRKLVYQLITGVGAAGG